jgi:hypothetical protein
MRNDIVLWVAKVGETLEAIPRKATRLLVEDARRPISSGGNMPVLSGNLRNSVEVSFSEVPPADRDLDPEKPLKNPAQRIFQTIESIKLGQRIRIGFRANYAVEAENKHAFVGLAAQKWLQFVTTAVRSAKRN